MTLCGNIYVRGAGDYDNAAIISFDFAVGIKTKEEIVESEERLKRFLQPLTNHFICGYHFATTKLDEQDNEIEHLLRFYLMPKSCSSQEQIKFRHEIKQADYENGVLIN